MSDDSAKQRRDALEAEIGDAWLAGDWDTALDKAREMTQLDRETGKKFIRVTEDHKMREGGPLWPRRKRSAS